MSAQGPGPRRAGTRTHLTSWALLLGLLTAGQATALNNCSPADFALNDRRGSNPLIISNDSPGNPFLYRPRCAMVAAGATVIFRALPNFGMHPLFAGTVSGGVGSIDPGSPIGSATSGNEHMVLINDSGEFPYFCDFHLANGMFGSLLVVPQLFADDFE